jgi:hypothetical protein
MTTSIAELAADVLGTRLGIVDINKSPTSAQRARVERLYDQKFAEMSSQDRVYWPHDEIPDLIAGALSRIIAEEMCPGLGMPVPAEADEDGQVVSIGTKGTRMLQRLLARDPTGAPTQASYF